MKPYLLLLAATMLAACSTKQAPSTEPTTADDPTVITLNDGTTVNWLKDNPGQRLMDRGLFADAPDSLFEALGLQEGIPSSVSTFLMKADDEWILFDTGLGAAHGGQTVNVLDSLGISTADINKIYITHFHGDHIGGLVQEGQPVFANATLYVGSVEYKAWIEEMPEERNSQQREAMEAYKDRLVFFEFGDTLPHNVIALDAIGHTPGHTAFEKGELLIIGDLMHGAALQMEHPEYNANFDMDKAKAAESRVRIIKYAREKGLTMAGMHLPEPAFMK